MWSCTDSAAEDVPSFSCFPYAAGLKGILHHRQHSAAPLICRDKFHLKHCSGQQFRGRTWCWEQRVVHHCAHGKDTSWALFGDELGWNIPPCVIPSHPCPFYSIKSGTGPNCLGILEANRAWKAAAPLVSLKPYSGPMALDALSILQAPGLHSGCLYWSSWCFRD